MLNAYTEFVADCHVTTYRKRAKRAGRVIVLSTRTRGGQYVTTAGRGVTR